MMDSMSTQEQQLCEFLKNQPRFHHNRYTETASNSLLQSLFWSLACGRGEYLRLFFPDNTRPLPNATWKLRKAQGGADGDEFTEAARGKACGHIFKGGEATYRCKTCSADDTCVLCSRCYDSSDHTGHMVYVSVSSGNSGCCDCGDPEAWRLPVHCAIHTAYDNAEQGKGEEKAAALPADLVEAIRMTIGRCFDYICDVISCSPEQLRLPKSEDSILQDEKMSRLTSKYYNGDIVEDPCEFALLLWNDEKHTVYDVRDQVARACHVSVAEGMQRAHETDDTGRSIIKYSFDVNELLRVSGVIEQIKLTVTIRSARDTFREQMCGTIIEWLSDIAGCSVGSDHDILRQVICEEMLRAWSTGSAATNKEIGMKGIHDYEKEDQADDNETYRQILLTRARVDLRAVAEAANPTASDTEEDSDFEPAEDGYDEDGVSGDEHDLAMTLGSDGEDEGDFGEDGANDVVDFLLAAAGHTIAPPPAIPTDTDGDGDVDMTERENSPMEASEATMAGYPPPPPPPPPALPRAIRDRDNTPSDSDTAEMQPLISDSVYAKTGGRIPKTPGNILKVDDVPKPPRYWLETPQAFTGQKNVPIHEDLWERLRLDWMILFDLRMWKKVRVDLRDLYISTVVSIPEFKRILGLRFAGLYTTLAQLYLIADREPDHSIINISLQMLTTPSITAEIVERGNFLTNLTAILYTFLTTRQVGHPHEINPNAVLAFDSGSVTNRRMYHFFMDLRYLFSSEHVQERLRSEDRYMMQFLDLVKLHQGICPNVRAATEHVEYETDAWISASLITREINRLCRQFSEAFKWSPGEDHTSIAKAIRMAAKAVILNSLGTEKKRFVGAEIKEDVKFKSVGDYEFDTTETSNSLVQHSVVRFVVESQPVSFHHALHYTLSWLIECGKTLSREQLTELLSFTTTDLMQKPKAMGQRSTPSSYTAEDHLIAAFDYPLRVCAWLAQMKAGMWVRNGMSLRHQMQTYRGVSQRDVSHHRDIFMLQTAMVVCPPARVLVSAIDRYGLEHWMKGIYEQKSDTLEDGQVLDVVEELIHLLIVLISDRTSLASNEETPSPHVLAMRRDITHVLCFKPLSFSEICTKLPDKFQDQEECQDILDEMTTFKPPEGLSDVGTFELKEKFLEDIDPYIAHYNKNQREESENSYKSWMAKKTGRPASDIVFEPKLRPVKSGAFSDLAAFTRTGIFAQIIYYSLLYSLKTTELTPTVPVTRVEAFLQVVLHLVLIAIAEDRTDEDEMSEESLQSFVYVALTGQARHNFMASAPTYKSIVAILEMLSSKEEFKACHIKIELVLRRMKQKRPHNFENAFARLGVPVDRVSTASPAINSALEERERKKMAALARQAKVMAQFQQQQKNFLDKQGDIDWGEDDTSDDNLEPEVEDHKSYWQYPSGTCILCQEETKDGRLYGTFALMTNSKIMRQTDFKDPDFVREVTKSPASLDRSAESIRPFGVAGENRVQVRKVTATGKEIIAERQFIGKGFNPESTKSGPVSVGCGHIMHYKCFAVYYEATKRRHQHQIARHHPEDIKRNEFVCPLCKALGNAFLPIMWSQKEEVPMANFRPNFDFVDWLPYVGPGRIVRQEKINITPLGAQKSRAVEHFMTYNNSLLPVPLSARMSELVLDAWNPSVPPSPLIPFPSGPASAMAMAVPQTVGPWVNDMAGPSSAVPPTPTVSPMTELVETYRRLKETMVKNKLPSRHTILAEQGHGIVNDFKASDTLARTLGFSISAVEIQQRGVESTGGTTFLESVPQQALTHLRILAESAASYVSIGGIRSAGDNIVTKEFAADYEDQTLALFLRQGSPSSLNLQEALLVCSNQGKNLLAQDLFVFLTECSLCLAPIDRVDIMHIVRLCYLAEIIKVVLHMGRNMGHSAYWQWISEAPSGQHSYFQTLCVHVIQWDREVGNVGEDIDSGSAMEQSCFDGLASCVSFAKNYALAFLRKATMLLHVRYGIAFHQHISASPDADELDRLSEALHLPNFDDICHLNASPVLFSLAQGWLQHAVAGGFFLGDRGDENRTWVAHRPLPSLSHPTIFELVGLPKNYDTLMEETMKRRCPTTGKDVNDPMLCLLCGVIFCGQSICCLKEITQPNGSKVQIGGAQQHRDKCQKNIGLFINIRKCCVFYLYHESGSWMVAPYIDKYGEVDPGLRHNRQLFLNQKRYDALLRTVWLGHGVPSVISRKLEMDVNNGGWETI